MIWNLQNNFYNHNVHNLFSLRNPSVPQSFSLFNAYSPPAAQQLFSFGNAFNNNIGNQYSPAANPAPQPKLPQPAVPQSPQPPQPKSNAGDTQAQGGNKLSPTQKTLIKNQIMSDVRINLFNYYSKIDSPEKKKTLAQDFGNIFNTTSNKIDGMLNNITEEDVAKADKLVDVDFINQVNKLENGVGVTQTNKMSDDNDKCLLDLDFIMQDNINVKGEDVLQNNTYHSDNPSTDYEVDIVYQQNLMKEGNRIQQRNSVIE